MPPPKAQRQLTPEEIARLRQWIEQGAPWTGHWSFQPLRAEPLPEPRGLATCRNEIDRFVLAAIEAQGLTPAPEADKHTLLRRLSLDLTGLPPRTRASSPIPRPTLLEAGRPPARLAALRRAHGAGWPTPRAPIRASGSTSTHAWPWRDWVVGAFNANMRFDEFRSSSSPATCCQRD